MFNVVPVCVALSGLGATPVVGTALRPVLWISSLQDSNLNAAHMNTDTLIIT
jgi:hypothetical protein